MTVTRKPILTVVLSLLLIGSLIGTVYFMKNAAALHSEQQARVDAAQSELDAAKANYAAIDPTTDEGMQRQVEAENAAVQDAIAEAAATEEENTALTREIDELTERLAELEADEDTAYYLAVYETMQAGMAKVEAAIEGN